jgi:hypothetical protein
LALTHEPSPVSYSLLIFTFLEWVGFVDIDPRSCFDKRESAEPMGPCHLWSPHLGRPLIRMASGPDLTLKRAFVPEASV